MEFFCNFEAKLSHMLEKITWEDANLFDYISEIEYLYVPEIDDYQYLININKGTRSEAPADKIGTPAFGYSEIVAIFKSRYNEGKLPKQNQYKEYRLWMGSRLRELNLDPDKFWCLFLFAIDYCRSLLTRGITMKATPMEQLQALLAMIDNAQDNPMSLQLKIQKKKTTIESPIAIHFMADAIKKQLEHADTIVELHAREAKDEMENTAESPLIVYFAKILLDFFNTQEHIKSKRKKGANHSLKEMEIVSRLVYFAELSYNKSWTDIENETLKGFLNRYKDYEYPNNISSIYPEFTVY